MLLELVEGLNQHYLVILILTLVIFLSQMWVQYCVPGNKDTNEHNRHPCQSYRELTLY